MRRRNRIGDITLDEPHRPVPLVIDLPQRGVTTPARTETMGAIGEPGLVIRLQHQAITSCTSLSDHVGNPNGRFFLVPFLSPSSRWD